MSKITVFTAKRIRTMNPSLPLATAVAVRDGKILEVGSLETLRPWLDAYPHVIDDTFRNHVLMPGFIDPHVHAREHIFELPNAEGYLLQGLTTVVDGNDGSSPLPLAPWFEKLAAATMSPNVASFVGQGTVREAVMGTANRKATPAEVTKMQALVAEAMRDGALGLSTGLAYVPGAFTPTDEIVALATTTREHGGIYVSHMRDEGGGVLESVKETIAIGERAKIPVQISHHKVGGRKQFGQSVQSLELIAAARQRGVDVTYDQYPYTASNTGITALLPQWALEGGRPRLLTRLADSAQRLRIKAEVVRRIRDDVGAGAVDAGGGSLRRLLARCGQGLLQLGPQLGGLGHLAHRARVQQLDLRQQHIERGTLAGCDALAEQHARNAGVDLGQRVVGARQQVGGSDDEVVTLGHGVERKAGFVGQRLEDIERLGQQFAVPVEAVAG